MKEVRDILTAYEEARKRNLETAIATVVRVEGSSYRQAGARMLVTEEGEITGAISGGCLEGDALRKALLAINQKTNKLVTYDTSEESDQAFTIQLGCNGIVHILFEYVDPENQRNPIRLLQHLTKQRENAVVVTLFTLNRHQPQPGTTMCYRENDVLAADDSFVSMLEGAVTDALRLQKSHIVSLDAMGAEGVIALIEFWPPPVTLVITGAGNDAIPLLKAAALIGWDVIVADGRATHATVRRFPEAREVRVAGAAELVDSLTIDERTLFALMTHNYRYDLLVLESVIRTSAPYIGVLGPKTKLNRMFTDLKDRGVELTDSQLNRIYGPVGFEIGAETSEEIAISMISEMKAVMSGKRGGSLRDKKEKIHSDAVV